MVSLRNEAASGGGSSPAGPTGRILAIDYGRRRIGLAVSDELHLTAQPLATLTRTNRRADQRRLRDVVREQRVTHIVIGHPLRLDGSAGPMAEEAARFAARLARELRLPVELVDERLTSWDAGELLAASGGSARNKPGAKRNSGAVDDVAAAIILRDYLERRRVPA